MFCHLQVHAALGPLSVAVRRPSLAALAALPALMKRKVPNKDGNGEDLGNDESSNGLNQELNREGFDVHSPGEVVAVESGKSRVAMRVNARVDTLRLALLLDDADEPDFDEVSHSIESGADFGKKARGEPRDASPRLASPTSWRTSRCTRPRSRRRSRSAP